MSPEHYVELDEALRPLRRATIIRRRRAPRRCSALRSAPMGTSPNYTEAVMKAYKDRTWAWGIEGLSLHSYTTGRLAARLCQREFRRKGLCDAWSKRR